MRALLALLRTIVAWIFTACFCTTLALLQVAMLRRTPPALNQSLVNWWGRTVLAILGIRLELLNENTMRTQAPRIFLCNHQSALDVLWMAAVTPAGPVAIGKKEIVWVPFINLGWWAMEYLYIDRKNPRKAVATMEKAAREVVERKRTMIIAPEGTRSPDGEILPFKRGAFKFAIETQAVICPVVVSGAYEILPKQKFLPRTGTIRLRFLPPVETKGLGSADVERLSREIRDSICAAYETQRAKG